MKAKKSSNVVALSLAEYLVLAYSAVIKPSSPQLLVEKLIRVRQKARRSELS